MKHPKKTGELTEQIIICEFMKLEVPVSKPIGDNQPYDLIIDIDSRLYKVQSRTGRLEEKGKAKCIKFNALSYRVNTKCVYTKDSRSEFDFFAVYYPMNGTVYLMRSLEVKADCGRLSLSNSKKIPHAVDRELVKMISDIRVGGRFDS